MAYARWTYSNWYVYPNASDGRLVCYHINGQVARYEYNRSVDYFIKKNFPKVDAGDKKELKHIIGLANLDYNDEREETK